MDQLRVFFEKMQQIGVSGLVVKVDCLMDHWSCSFDYQIPLIKVQQDVSYEAIMLAVYETAFESPNRSCEPILSLVFS